MMVEVCAQDIYTKKRIAQKKAGDAGVRKEENKRSLLRQAYRMKQECPHMSPVGLEYEMYAAIMKEVREITARLQLSAEA